jgi:hypothetical protein
VTRAWRVKNTDLPAQQVKIRVVLPTHYKTGTATSPSRSWNMRNDNDNDSPWSLVSDCLMVLAGTQYLSKQGENQSPIAYHSYWHCRESGLPTTGEPHNSRNGCYSRPSTHLTLSMLALSSDDHPAHGSTWGSRKVGRCGGGTSTLSLPIPHKQPSGDSPKPFGIWGSGRGGGNRGPPTPLKRRLHAEPSGPPSAHSSTRGSRKRIGGRGGIGRGPPHPDTVTRTLKAGAYNTDPYSQYRIATILSYPIFTDQLPYWSNVHKRTTYPSEKGKIITHVMGQTPPGIKGPSAQPTPSIGEGDGGGGGGEGGITPPPDSEIRNDNGDKTPKMTQGRIAKGLNPGRANKRSTPATNQSSEWRNSIGGNTPRKMCKHVAKGLHPGRERRRDSRTSMDWGAQSKEMSSTSLTTDSHRVNTQSRSHCADDHARDQYDTQTPRARCNLLARNRNARYGDTCATWVTKPMPYSKVPNTYMRRQRPNEPMQESNGSKVKPHRNAREQQTLYVNPGTTPKEVTLQRPASKAMPQERGSLLLLHRGLPTSMTTAVGQVVKARQPYNVTHAREAHQPQRDVLRPQNSSSQCQRIDHPWSALHARVNVMRLKTSCTKSLVDALRIPTSDNKPTRMDLAGSVHHLQVNVARQKTLHTRRDTSRLQTLSAGSLYTMCTPAHTLCTPSTHLAYISSLPRTRCPELIPPMADSTRTFQRHYEIWGSGITPKLHRLRRTQARQPYLTDMRCTETQQRQQSQSQTPPEAENLETVKTTPLCQTETSSEISSKLAPQPRQVHATSETAGTSICLLKDSQSFKVMNRHTRIQVYSETRNLCILHSEFRGRRLTGIAKGSKQATHCRATPVVGRKTVRESDRLAHLGLVLIFVSHKGRLHGPRDKNVYCTTNYGYTIYIMLQPITDRTNIVIRQGKQPHVTNMTKDTESVNDMPPKKQQQRDQPQSGPPNPNTRARGQNRDPEQQTPATSEAKGKGKAKPDAPSQGKAVPAPPKKKTPAQKRKEREAAESAYNETLPDPLFGPIDEDLAVIRARKLLELPAWQGAEDLVTTPSVGTSADLPPSTCGVSPDQYLQPPTHADTSSSASSRASKHRRNASPAPPPRRPPYRPSEAEARPPRRPSPLRRPPERQPYHPSDADLVAELRSRLENAEEEIDHLERLRVQDYEVGYQ